ncbi:MAG: hypothetical protein ABSG95_04865 [Solirubrobacteraceae bacterium]
MVLALLGGVAGCGGTHEKKASELCPSGEEVRIVAKEYGTCVPKKASQETTTAPTHTTTASPYQSEWATDRSWRLGYVKLCYLRHAHTSNIEEETLGPCVCEVLYVEAHVSPKWLKQDERSHEEAEKAEAVLNETGEAGHCRTVEGSKPPLSYRCEQPLPPESELLPSEVEELASCGGEQQR